MISRPASHIVRTTAEQLWQNRAIKMHDDGIPIIDISCLSPNGKSKHQQHLGKGVHGSVYRAALRPAIENAIRVECAVKPFSQDHTRFFLQEARCLNGLSGLEGVPKLYSAIITGKMSSLCLELFPGSTIYTLMIEPGKTPNEPRGVREDAARRVIKQVLQVLDSMHQIGWAHQDIKGENVLLKTECRNLATWMSNHPRDYSLLDIVLCDFAFSKHSTDSPHSSEVGTEDYLCPEELDSKLLTHTQRCAKDVWAVGILAYELLFCKTPFEHSSSKVTRHRIKNSRIRIPSGTSAHASHFLNKCLDRNVESRATAGDLLFHPWILEDAFNLEI